MTRRSILIALPIVPWPLRSNGIAVRYYPVLEELARHCDVDVLITNDSAAIEQARSDPLIRSLRSVTLLPQIENPTFLGRLAMGLRAANPLGIPYEVARYGLEIIAGEITRLSTEHRYDTIHVVAANCRIALDQVAHTLHGVRLTWDAIDSTVLYYERNAEPNVFSRRSSWFRAYDIWKTRRWETRLQRGVDASIYISAIDANAAGPAPGVEVIPNGISAPADLPPTRDRSNAPPCIGFLGNMAYPPNIVGAEALYRDVFLPLKAEFPDLRLKIIGRSPGESIKAFAGPDVEITGMVDDIWSHIADVDVFVIPMKSGAGLQNKIIEAMYAGKPVVTTPMCQQSVGADDTELVVGRSSEEVREQTKALLLDKPRAAAIAKRGQAFVRAKFEVNNVVKRFVDVLLGPGA